MSTPSHKAGNETKNDFSIDELEAKHIMNRQSFIKTADEPLVEDALKVPYVRVVQTGVNIVHNPHYNKGSAFTREERIALKIEGLIPPSVETQDQQVVRSLDVLRRAHSDLERYIHLQSLSTRNERLFFRVLMDNLEEFMPVVYTPTVGLACQEFSFIWQQSQGLYITINDRGRVFDILQNWPNTQVRGIVFTDGERILGLGDLGSNGMGIPVGKLHLYTACSGIDPKLLLPVTIDVGTNNQKLLKDPFYKGIRAERERGPAYDELIEEFINAVKKRWGPYTLLQFEDFGNSNAFRLLEQYKDQCCTFNDDIQGTSAVTLAGILSSLRVTKSKLADHTIVIMGAGEAGLGIANLTAEAIAIDGNISIEEARTHISMVDSKGLVTKNRPTGGNGGHKAPFAHDRPHVDNDLEKIVKETKATMLIGVSAIPQTFTKGVVEAMCANTERPLIFPLSNPTSQAECTAEQAYTWSKGKAIFASGSPFKPVTIGDKTFTPGQGNNAYIFPGVALAVIYSGARRVTDRMFMVSAKALSEQVTDAMIEKGLIYPPLHTIREVSIHVGAAVAEEIYNAGLASYAPKPKDLVSFLRRNQYTTKYPRFA